ncbi:SRPBCC domain-containing protein [Streptomyces sp. BSE7-9]|uniref:SRPBCC domain-containing protein n=1 Tax=Streptomyces sp. BSE7-9 TaxID=2759948 RepID=UPI0018EE68CD|nr:SRPBCC domain-containing protein [Streptomyces sp. BSE7-9]MBJ6644823.1 carbon monoxide dehydrogenase [Streptomyces sp. BSE7-9]
MEHEVFVPVEAQRLREVLDDPARVARAVPGLQHDAGAEPVTGRLKVRIGGSSITYRGSVRVSAQDDGVYAVEGEASESRGDGTVRLSLRLTPRPADAGTALVVTGTATADGRVTDLPQEAVTSAVTRLLNRFAENLAAAAEEKAVPPGSPEQVAAGDAEEAVPPESPEQLAAGDAEDAAPPESPEQLAAGDAEDAAPPESPEQLAAGDFEPGATTDFETTPDAEDTPPPPPQQRSDAAPDEQSGPATAPEPPSPSDAGPEPASPSDAGPEPASPSDAGPVPSTPEPLDADLSDDIDGRPLPGDDEDDSLAEAAHARRTMIGRSAEEVDHAPPRGRYAPVPAPQTVASSAPLRWAAPAAALAVASAVVAIRALRRRR